MTGEDRDDLDPTAAPADYIGTDDGVGLVIAALDDHVGLQRLDQCKRGVVVEEDHAVDALERGNDARPFGGRNDGPVSTLAEPLRRRVAVDTHDQRCAERCGGLEYRDVPNMEEVEYAVREDHRTRRAIAPRLCLASRPDLGA